MKFFKRGALRFCVITFGFVSPCQEVKEEVEEWINKKTDTPPLTKEEEK